MEKVLGIGGVFFRAQNPQALSEWYETHLGISPVPDNYEEQPWHQDSGPTVFAPFAMDSNYFGKASQSWMINFRVKDLVSMVNQLREAGTKVEIDENEYPNGQFARLYDPEGNPIELWQAKSSNS